MDYYSPDGTKSTYHLAVNEDMDVSTSPDYTGTGDYRHDTALLSRISGVWPIPYVAQPDGSSGNDYASLDATTVILRRRPVRRERLWCKWQLRRCGRLPSSFHERPQHATGGLRLQLLRILSRQSAQHGPNVLGRRGEHGHSIFAGQHWPGDRAPNTHSVYCRATTMLRTSCVWRLATKNAGPPFTRSCTGCSPRSAPRDPAAFTSTPLTRS